MGNTNEELKKQNEQLTYEREEQQREGQESNNQEIEKQQSERQQGNNQEIENQQIGKQDNNNQDDEKQQNNNQESEKQRSKGQENKKQQIKKKGIGSKILNIILKIMCFAIIVGILVIAIRAVVYKKYDVFGYRFYIIMSGSMEPKMHISDGIITKECDEYKKGDVISFEINGSTTMHRIIEVYTEDGQKLYLTQGDANNAVDNWSGQKMGAVKHNQVKGKAIIRIPQVGNFALFLRTNCVIILIFIIGISAVIFVIRRAFG